MNVQDCGIGFETRDVPSDPQHNIIKRQMEFQMRVGAWDTRLKDYGSEPFCLPRRALHHLDMALQECSEAWDMVEGGWKHHKTNPKPTDPVELLMELVDVYHFLVNAYLFMGGQPEAVMVAASVGRSREEIKLASMDLETVWGIGARSWAGNFQRIVSAYGHVDGAHGRVWEGSMATRINHLRAQVAKVSATMRHGLGMAAVNHTSFPAVSGYVYIELMPWLMVAFQGLPEYCLGEVTPRLVYSAFCHKNDINNARQDGGY